MNCALPLPAEGFDFNFSTFEFGPVPLPFDLGVVISVEESGSPITDKVLLPFGDDLTRLEWKLEQLCQVLPPECIYVSTDSANLRRLAAPYGVNFHDRDPRPCRSSEATCSEAIAGIVKSLPHAHVAWVTVDLPLMSPAEYYHGFLEYHQQVMQAGAFDSLFAASLVHESPWLQDRPANHPDHRYPPDVYQVTNGLFMRDRASILRDGGFLGKRPFKFLVGQTSAAELGGLDNFSTAGKPHPRLESRAVKLETL